MSSVTINTVLFDFGGVITESPFDNFARYEAEHGLPVDFLRTVNSTNPDDNAWAKIERRDVTAAEFDELFAAESAALGHRVPGREVLAMLKVGVRPAMEQLLDRVNNAGYITACLTNNVASNDMDAKAHPVMEKFAHIIESSVIGVRKPEPEFYEIACTTVGVEPAQCVFLDDLGINLKPARAMGMTTIKVTSAAQAIADLSAQLNL